MPDKHTPEQRSYNMSQIRGTGTKPEELVRKYLFSRGLRYRKNVTGLPGKPDIVLSKYRTAIFVNGCFWHMHNCGRFVWPKSNTEYWEKKITNNVVRDQENKSKLSDAGWKVIVVWECELKKNRMEITLDSLYNEIISN